jgi:flagella basal body P-ring formation protein FlgA
MIRLMCHILLCSLPVLALADVVVPTRTIRAKTIISATDVTIKQIPNAEGYFDVNDVIGQEARIALYAGRPILVDDIGPPALIARNQIVPMMFLSDGLMITAEGRSLQRGGIGDRIRVMNLSSRATLFGQVQADGSVRVYK